MKRCPKCMVPHETPTFADLVAEEELLVTQAIIGAEAEAQLNRISRARLVQALRGFGYCQQCILIKGSIIGAEVGAAAVFDPPSPKEIEHAFVDRPSAKVLVFNPLRVADHELFRRSTDCLPGPNDDGMDEQQHPQKGA